jgi:GT2 family glycosyltransferase
MMEDAATATPRDGPGAATPAISVVIPVHNGAAMLERCLEALWRSQGVEWECIVVDDRSTDDSAAVARRRGARVLQVAHPSRGPAQARNAGARVARAPLLCFLDSDVLVRPNTLATFVALFDADPSLAAAFGSYDTQPVDPGLVSQYRNLLHHFVHQSSHEAASTFWSGCGAIRRDDFWDLGGFDPTFTRPSVEDIDLGYRLRTRGRRVLLAKQIQVTHLKRWTFPRFLLTDVRDRALPWTALIASSGYLPDDLNVDRASRVSALSLYALLALLTLGWWQPIAWPLALLPLLLVLWLNRRLYAFFARERGPAFLLAALPLHWLYYASAALAFGVGIVPILLRQRTARADAASIVPMSATYPDYGADTGRGS